MSVLYHWPLIVCFNFNNASTRSHFFTYFLYFCVCFRVVPAKPQHNQIKMAPPTNMPTPVECSNGHSNGHSKVHSNGHSNGAMNMNRPIIAKSLKRPFSSTNNNNSGTTASTFSDAKRKCLLLIFLSECITCITFLGVADESIFSIDKLTIN